MAIEVVTQVAARHRLEIPGGAHMLTQGLLEVFFLESVRVARHQVFEDAALQGPKARAKQARMQLPQALQQGVDGARGARPLALGTPGAGLARAGRTALGVRRWGRARFSRRGVQGGGLTHGSVTVAGHGHNLGHED
jgi:hypothetical protein